MKRENGRCIECGSLDIKTLSQEIDDEELYVKGICGKCGVITYHLYNLSFYNAVTVEEFDAGEVEAGL